MIICPESYYIDVTLKFRGTPVVLCCASGTGSLESENPSFVFEECEMGLVVPKAVILLYLRTDANPQETTFSLLDIASNELLWDVYTGTTELGEPLRANEEYRYEITVDGSRCYLFTIQDAGNDGLTASADAVFELYYNGEIVVLGQEFGNESAMAVGDGCFV